LGKRVFPVIALGPFELRSYFVVMALALAVPMFYAPRRAEKILPEKARDFGNMLLFMYLSALVGFRLFYVAFVLPDYFWAHPLEIFKVWKGGFVAYGGLFLPVAVFMVWVWWKKMPALLTADILAPSIVLVFAVARVACFLNGCCFGKPTQGIFGVVFPPGSVAHRFYPGASLHPTQLYLSVSALVVYGVIMLFETKLRRYYFKGLSSAIFLVLYPLSRFIVEFYRADFRGGMFFGLSVSQCLSLLLIALGAAVFVKGRERGFPASPSAAKT